MTDEILKLADDLFHKDYPLAKGVFADVTRDQGYYANLRNVYRRVVAAARADLAAENKRLMDDAARWNFVMTTEPYASCLWISLPPDVRDSNRHINNAIDEMRPQPSKEPTE